MRITKYRLRDRTFLLGPPGVGKTEYIREQAITVAKNKSKTFIDLREADDETINKIIAAPGQYYVFYRILAPHVFPEDIGKPESNGAQQFKFVELIPPKYIAVLSLPDIEGVLFIDELTNVKRDDQITVFFSLILEKEAGWGLKLSKNVAIIAAGNPPEWSEVTRGLPKPLRNRMTLLKIEPPTVDEWAAYMDTHYENWDKRTYIYLKLYPNDFLVPPPEDDEFTAFPTPRSWAFIATLLPQLEEHEVEDYIIGNLGVEVGTKFIALLRTKIDERLAEELKTRPELFETLNVSQRALVLYSIAQQPLEKLSEYTALIKYLTDTNADYAVLLVTLIPRQIRTQFVKANIAVFKQIARMLVE